MTETAIFSHRYDNGLILLAEPIAGVQSLAMSVLLPAGIVAEPDHQAGVTTLLSEMICRGAGDLDAKAHSDALDFLGVQRGTAVQTTHLHLAASMLATKLPDALPLLLDMVRRPMLGEAALEPSRDLALQDLDALEDEPQQKVFIELRQRHYPQPFGRSPMGQRPDLEAMTLKQVRDYWASRFVPGGTIIGFAGHFDWEQLKELVGAQLGDWQGQVQEPETTTPPPRGYTHLPADTSQVHIGLAYDAVTETDPDSLLQRACAAVLSGGMSGRLFTNIREKHGLCYAVSASYASSKHLGSMLSYAGTTSARAQQTLDLLRQELVRLSEGVEPDEFRRAIVGMKSRLVMQGESTSARAHAITSDQYTFGRPRTLDEQAAEVDAVTLEKLNTYAAEHRPGQMTIATIGPGELKVQ